MGKVFYNAKIYSLDSKKNIYSVLVTNKFGKIEYVGNNYEKDKFLNYEEIDLNQKFVYPGFIDSHLHMLNYAFIETNIKLYDCKSVEDIQNKIFERNNLNKNKKEWIFGRGWNQDNFIKNEPKIEKKDLDKISEKVPIFLIRVCGHEAVANTKALEEILKLERCKDFFKYIDKKKGILLEGAVKLCYDAMPAFNHKKIEDLIKIAAKNLNECGITSVHSDNFLSLPGKNYKEVVKAFKNLDKRGELSVRVCDQASFMNKEELKKFINDREYSEVKSEFYKIGPIKIYQDGSLGAKTALLKEGYVNDKKNRGIAIHSIQNLKEMMEIAHKDGRQVIVHTIGDLALEQVLDCLEDINFKYPRNNHRHGIVHAQITTSELLERIRKNEMIVYIQPVFIASDMDMIEELIGKKRERESYAWKSMKDMGIMISGGSDSPVERFDILENIQIAITRKKLEDKDGESWLAYEKLTKEDSLEIFTKNGAYASFEEKIKGTLEVGKIGDFVVLDRDIFEIEESAIKDIKVLKTIVNGVVVYE
ncbi:MAG: amidohydrolase [Cetobacterium sp.]